MNLRRYVARVKTELAYYRVLATHPGTPWLSRMLIGLAIAYLLSPVDIIPDFIPVLGYLDDVVLVPGLLWLALVLVPAEVKRAARIKAAPTTPEDEDS